MWQAAIFFKKQGQLVMKVVIDASVVFPLGDITFDSIVGFEYNGGKYFARKVLYADHFEVHVSTFNQMIRGFSAWNFKEADLEDFKSLVNTHRSFVFENKEELFEWIGKE